MLLQEVTIYDYVTELRRRKYGHRRGTQHLKVSEHTTLYGSSALSSYDPFQVAEFFFRNERH